MTLRIPLHTARQHRQLYTRATSINPGTSDATSSIAIPMLNVLSMPGRNTVTPYLTPFACLHFVVVLIDFYDIVPLAVTVAVAPQRSGRRG
jgi:hypothetical protein